MALIKIAEIGKDFREFRLQILQQVRPAGEIGILRSLHDVETREIAGAHPAHIGKIGSQVRGKKSDVRIAKPLPVDQRAGHTKFFEQSHNIMVQPITIPEFDGKSNVTRKIRKESLERLAVFQGAIKVWWHLNQHAGKLFIEDSDSVAKLVEYGN